MTVISYPNGIGGSTGDAIVTEKPLYASDHFVYVDKATGDDSDPQAGKDRSKPYKTLAAAISAASGGETIVLLDGHTEEINDGGVNIAVPLTIVGEGADSSGGPTAVLTHDHATNEVFATSGAGVLTLRNVKFISGANAATPVTHSAPALFLQAAAEIDGCVFEADGAYNAPMVGASAPGITFRNCTFKSVETDASDRPYSVVQLGGPAAVFATFLDCTFDGGTVGFADGSNNPYALICVDGSATPQHFVMERCQLLNGADVRVHSSYSWLAHISKSTGNAKIVEEAGGAP